MHWIGVRCIGSMGIICFQLDSLQATDNLQPMCSLMVSLRRRRQLLLRTISISALFYSRGQHASSLAYELIGPDKQNAPLISSYLSLEKLSQTSQPSNLRKHVSYLILAHPRHEVQLLHHRTCPCWCHRGSSFAD
jgi:hypothetical protein